MDKDGLRRIVSEAKAIILDIEGTIASIDFTRKEAFPYVESHIEDYITKNWEEVKNTLSLIQQQSMQDSKEISNDVVQLPSVPISENAEEIQKCLTAVIGYVKHQMKNNRSDRAMKEIQGLALQNAFRNGDILAHIYSDATKVLENWSHEGKLVYTYSTGSRATQVEYFKNTIQGDLSNFVKSYFDTSIGSKLECEGFKFICSYAEVDPNEAVFFSDRPKEIIAAKKSGLKAILVDRESEFSLIKEEQDFLGHEDGKISSFSEILADSWNNFQDLNN